MLVSDNRDQSANGDVNPQTVICHHIILCKLYYVKNMTIFILWKNQIVYLINNF